MVDTVQWLWFAFWSAMVFGSLAWYGSLLFYVGWHGGWEIIQLARRMKTKPQPGRPEAPVDDSAPKSH